jgi:hypothetical protein
MLKSILFKLKHTHFFKKKKKREVMRNTLNNNIFEYWGNIRDAS